MQSLLQFNHSSHCRSLLTTRPHLPHVALGESYAYMLLQTPQIDSNSVYGVIYSLSWVWKGSQLLRAKLVTDCNHIGHGVFYGRVFFLFFFYWRDPQTSGTHLELFNERLRLPDSSLQAHHQLASFWSCQETSALISSLAKAK